MPRSLVFCAQYLEDNVVTLSKLYGQQQRCNEAASQLRAMVENTNMEAIFAFGLHEFLTEFMARADHVSNTLSESYNFY